MKGLSNGRYDETFAGEDGILVQPKKLKCHHEIMHFLKTSLAQFALTGLLANPTDWYVDQCLFLAGLE